MPTEYKSFVKSSQVLKEDYRVEDLFDTDASARKFISKLEQAPNRSIIGLVGAYGTGKSTLLHQVSREVKKDFWIEFDAWKYPERKELWEGFVLDFTRQIDSKEFDKARATIDGTQNDDKKTLIRTIGDIPGFAAVKNLTHFYETSPARRTFEIQDILTKLLASRAKSKAIYVVVEDIDRSGDAGIFFLETLRYFLQNLDTQNIIKIIVPIADGKFYDNSDSYIKCLDIVEFYQLLNVKMDKFMESVFATEFIETPIIRTQLSQFLERLMQEPGITPRKLKLILRKADLNYINQQIDGLEPDFRVSILFEVSKYLPVSKSDATVLFKYFIHHKIIGGELLTAFASAIAANTHLVDSDNKLVHNAQQFRLITRTGTSQQYPSTPYRVDRNFGNEHRSFCCDFYLDY